MSSVLTSIKQVPVTGGKFVCISATNSLFNITNPTDRVPTDTTVDSAAAVGDEYIDLGVTYVDKATNIVYRKVVSVVSAQTNAPAPKFIQTFNPTTGLVYFARTA